MPHRQAVSCLIFWKGVGGHVTSAFLHSKENGFTCIDFELMNFPLLINEAGNKRVQNISVKDFIVFGQVLLLGKALLKLKYKSDDINL